MYSRTMRLDRNKIEAKYHVCMKINKAVLVLFDFSPVKCLCILFTGPWTYGPLECWILKTFEQTIFVIIRCDIASRNYCHLEKLCFLLYRFRSPSLKIELKITKTTDFGIRCLDSRVLTVQRSMGPWSGNYSLFQKQAEMNDLASRAEVV